VVPVRIQTGNLGYIDGSAIGGSLALPLLFLG
jgi:hypothetical protein